MAKHCNIDRVLSIYFELYTYNLSFMFYEAELYVYNLYLHWNNFNRATYIRINYIIPLMPLTFIYA